MRTVNSQSFTDRSTGRTARIAEKEIGFGIERHTYTLIVRNYYGKIAHKSYHDTAEEAKAALESAGGNWFTAIK